MSDVKYYQLTHPQKRIWYTEKIYPDTGISNNGFTLRLKRSIDYALLEKAINIVVHKNDSLRMRLVELDEEIMQYVSPYKEIKVDFFDFSGQDEEAFRAWADSITKKPFNAFESSLIYFAMLKFNGSEGGFFIKRHHIAADGFTIKSIINQIASVYEDLKSGTEIPQDKKPSYIKYILNEEKYKASSKFEENRKFWLDKFEALPEGSFLKPQNTSFESASIHRKVFSFPGELLEKLNKYCTEYSSSVFRLFLGAFYMYMARMTSKEDIVIGTILHNRFDNEALDMAGMLASTTPIRISTAIDTDFRSLDKIIAKEMKSAIRHQAYPFDLLLQDLRKIHKEFKGLFDVLLLYEETRIIEGLTEEWHHNGNEAYALTIRLSDCKEEGWLKMELDYQTALFSDDEADKIFEYIVELLNNAMEDPKTKVSQIEMLPQNETQRLLFNFNDTKCGYPHTKTIHSMFEEQVERTPDALAAIFEDQKLTYGELNGMANMLALSLREKGVRPDSIIAIMLERSQEMIVGILGILKAGGAYLPIDPNYPAERIKFLLHDSGTSLLLTEEKYIKELDIDESIQIVNLNDESSYSGDGSNLESINISNNLAYVIYTSGTTGKPKGAMIEHHSVINRLTWMQKRYPLNETDIILQKTPYTFDVSVWEMFWWSFFGSGVCFLKPNGEKDPEEIAAAVEKNKITVMHFVPSMLNVFLEYIEEQDSAARLSSLRQVFASGEALTVHQAEKFNTILNKKHGTKLTNLYGPTEATVDVTYFDCSEGEKLEIVPIGKPIDNTSLYILDKSKRLMPQGTAGELYIAGVGLARGYFGRPELTAERFVPNPFIPGGRMYRTGDLARWLADGNIEYLGRTDYQVKIKGFRIELGEIEASLLNHTLVKEAAVTVKEGRTGDKYLCAYYVSDEELSQDELKAFLSKSLPHYMVPSFFVWLSCMPLTGSGKLDRKALPDPSGSFGAGAIYTAPQNKVEARLVEIWSEMLEVDIDKLGTMDNFISLGGDSIRAIRVVSRINKTFNTGIQIRDLYRYPVLKELSDFIIQSGEGFGTQAVESAKEQLEEMKRNIFEDSALCARLPQNIEDIYPMSDIEKGMVYYSLKFTGKGVYHDQFLYQIKDSSFDFNLFKETVSIMILKHQILRTNYNIQDFGIPMRVVHKDIEVDVELISLKGLEKSEQEKYIKNFMEQDRAKPFNIKNTTKKPLWRIRVFTLSEQNICLCWIFHHAIMDGWSIASFITELINTYFRLKTEDFDSGEIKSCYKDFIIDQIVTKNDAEIADFWKEELKDYKRLNLPKIAAGEDDENDRVNVIIHKMDLSILERLKDTARSLNTSVKNICFAAYLYMFGMLSYENDIVVGLVENNRPACEDGDKILGCFLNTIPVRLTLKETMTWAEMLESVDKKLVDLKLYGRLPLFDIKKATGESTYEENPIFDMLFNFVDFHIFNRLENKDVFESTLSVVNFERTNTLFDFTVFSILNEFGVRVNFIEPVFTKSDVEKLLGYYVNILNAFINDHDKLINKTQILSSGERKQLLLDFNDTKTGYPKSSTIHELFTMQAERTPDAVALVFGEKQITYSELNKRANRLAWTLKGKGVGRDSLVGLMVSRSIEMMVGILGVMKAGGAYLPIDPEYPSDRIRFMLEDSGASLLMVFNAELPESIGGDASLDIIDLGIDSSYSSNDLNPEIINTPDDLIYVIYTSGSTGKPKGVMLTHKSVNNFIKGISCLIDFSPYKTILCVTTISFDIFVLETLLPLVKGLKVVIADENQQRDARALNDVIVKNKVEMIQTTPSRMQLLIDGTGGKPDLTGLKELMLGGEAFPLALLKELKSLTNAKIYNMYGPTETTVWSAVKELTDSDVMTLGKPIANTYIYIVDKNNNLQPAGIPGELCIGGDGLARGYLGRPELTAERFVSNPFLKLSDSSFSPITDNPSPITTLIYRTGDIARWLPDGELLFMGRTDNQVKIRGFRIELGEIESRLRRYEAIKEAVVTASEDEKGNKFLCAYYVSDTQLTVSGLREYLSIELPDYMVPSYFVQLSEMPLTPNGKTNLKALPKPYGDIVTGVPYKSPESEGEILLAGILSKVLGIDKVGVDDSFFDLGGDSIKAIQIIGAAEQQGLEILVSDVFKHKTIAKILHVVESRKDSPEAKGKKSEEISPVEELQESIPAKSAENEGIPDAMELALNMENDITSYLNHTLPLCGVLSEPKFLPWFYENYVQIFCRTDENGYLILEFLHSWAPYRLVAEQTCLGTGYLKDVPDIVEYVIHKVSINYYVIINFDEYYIPQKASYKKYHYVHPILIYGYDRSRRILKAAGFNAEHIFTRLELRYDDFRIAYESGKRHYKDWAPWCENTTIEAFKLRDFKNDYPFDPLKLLAKLKAYVESEGDYSVLYALGVEWEGPEAQKVNFGINIYDDLIAHLENILQDKLTMDYRAVHLMYEHKKAVYKRLRYMVEKYGITGKAARLVDDYYEVCKTVDSARLLYMEKTFNPGELFFAPLTDKPAAARIIELLRLAKEQEGPLLKKICEQLQKHVKK